MSQVSVHGGGAVLAWPVRPLGVAPRPDGIYWVRHNRWGPNVSATVAEFTFGSGWCFIGDWRFFPDGEIEVVSGRLAHPEVGR